MKKHTKNTKRSTIKLENFLMTNSAVAYGLILAFVRCWGIPVRSIVDTYKESKNNSDATFSDILSDKYSDYVIDVSNIPFQIYDKYKKRGQQRLKNFDAQNKKCR